MLTDDVRAAGGGAAADWHDSMGAVAAIAVFGVIADQVGGATGLTVSNAWRAAFIGRLDAGVAVIIVVAAVLLYRPFVAEPVRCSRLELADLWTRRLVRWVLTLWVVVAVTFLLTARSESTGEWVRHMVLAQALSYRHVHPAMTHLWPVTAAAGLVILAPIVGGLIARRSSAVPATRHMLAAGGLVVAGLALRAWCHRHDVGSLVLQWSPATLMWFGVAIVVAVASAGRADAPYVHTLRAWAAAPVTCWSAGGLVWLLSTTRLASGPVFSTLTPWQLTIRNVLDGVTAFLIVLPVAAGTPRRSGPRAQRVGSTLASLAFGTFLWQLPVLLAVQDLFDLRPFGGRFVRTWLLTTFGALGCAWLTREVVDGAVRPALVRRVPWRLRARTSSESPVRPPA